MDHSELLALTGDGHLVARDGVAVIGAGDVPLPHGRAIRKPRQSQRSGRPEIRMVFSARRTYVAALRLKNAGLDPAVIAREAIEAAAEKVKTGGSV